MAAAYLARPNGFMFRAALGAFATVSSMYTLNVLNESSEICSKSWEVEFRSCHVEGKTKQIVSRVDVDSTCNLSWSLVLCIWVRHDPHSAVLCVILHVVFVWVCICRGLICFCAHSFDGIGMNKHCFIFEMCMHIDVREYCVWTYYGVRSRLYFSAYFAWANCNNSRWFSHLPSLHLAGNSVFSLSLLHQHVHALLGSPYTSLGFCPPKY